MINIWTRLWRKGVHKARVVQYNVLYRLWVVWHCDAKNFFDLFAGYVAVNEDTDERVWFPTFRGANRFRIKSQKVNDLAFIYVRRHSFWRTGRPCWHLCCNGDAGGWRTKLCDALEGRWRRMEGQIYYGDE